MSLLAQISTKTESTVVVLLLMLLLIVVANKVVHDSVAAVAVHGVTYKWLLTLFVVNGVFYQKKIMKVILMICCLHFIHK